MTPSRLLIIPASALLLASCARNKGELDETGGQRITRSVCPAVAIPAYTGDVSIFSPEQSRDARALDLTATITNIRTSCDDTGPVVKTAVTFDIVAQRASHTGARDVVLPYFWTVVRAGTTVMSKQVSQVQVHFADGQVRGAGSGGAGAEVQKALASLPAEVTARVNRRRKPTDADASIDPMADPKTRAIVARANFELLVGFQLTQAQLAYNATR